MSQHRSVDEMKRFLASDQAEVLSVSGRWGVGKTHAWNTTLSSERRRCTRRRYAYVSAFGLRSLDALQTAIVQSTVSLDGADLEPTLQSFVEHVSSLDGVTNFAEQTARKSLNVITRGAAAIPYLGRMADLLAPGAALLIRNQVVCIDDVERAGQGLDVADILGLVSTLRERRNCKVVLLLNEEGLAEQAARYRELVEKVVDQAVRFEPTPAESAASALDMRDPLSAELGARSAQLGMTNIRVIRRIRRFLSHVEPQLEGAHPEVRRALVRSITLLGWCVFEPRQAPSLERVRKSNPLRGMFSSDARSEEEKRIDGSIQDYGFQFFDEVDAELLKGLQSGAFDAAALGSLLQSASRQAEMGDARAAVAKPWSLYHDSFEANCDEFVEALETSVREHASVMPPADASGACRMLRELGRHEQADRLAETYVQAQAGRRREFFDKTRWFNGQELDPAISVAFEAMLAARPLAGDPAELLLGIGRKEGWDPDEVAFLASVPVDGYLAVLRRLRGDELKTAIKAALQFGTFKPASEAEGEIANRMKSALRAVGAENPLNQSRARLYLANVEPGDDV